ncbi:internal virion protein with endolysin domain [Xylella phage Paz]|uniref:Internal virion protein n=1 Tax=Xylella phage Paz TaxID=1415145 RepID=V5Q9M1_9CAUD|nr:internal virion protein with endolysin domain [Xylella phage Paz]AHB12135.1 internal virion protein [Xylella phage Paz]
MNTLDLAGLTLDQKFEAAGKFAGVPSQLFAGMWAVESGKGTNMTSRAGARGHFQTMPDTQATWEERTGRSFDPDNFDDSLNMAALTMRENMQKFKTIPDALRAYNSGWDRSKWGNDETSSYVGKIATEGGMALAGAMTMTYNKVNPNGNMDAAFKGKDFDEALFEKAWAGEALGDFSALKAAAIKKHLTDVEKGTANLAAVQTAAINVGNANVAELAHAAQAKVENDAAANVAAYTATTGKSTIDTSTASISSGEVKKRMDAALEREAYAQSLTATDKWGASFGSSLMAGMMRYYDNEVNDAYPKGWSYMDSAYEQEKGYSLREREFLREAVSPQDLARIQGDIAQQRADAQLLGHLSQSSRFGWSIAAGFSDPVGWAAGLGVGKAAQMAKVGAATYIAAGRPISALAAAGAEGAIGNLITGAALDAMGDYRTLGDYVSDAGFGLAFGAVLSAPGIARDARIAGVQRAMHAQAAINDAELALRAQEMAGPGATPDQLARAMQTVEEADDNAWRQATLGNVPDGDRFMARANVGEAADPAVSYSRFANDGDRLAYIQQKQFDQSIAGDDMRAMVAEFSVRSEDIVRRYPIDEAKLKTFLSAVDFEATSTTLMADKSPVSKALGILIAESPEGAAGRHSTASVSRTAHFEQYMGNINRNTDTLFDMWAREQGFGTVRQAMDPEVRIRFNKEVQLEMNRRWNKQPEGAIHPAVKRAADIYDQGYKIMGKDQRHVGVIGADAIDLENNGYFQRSWNLGMLRGMGASQRSAFVNALEDQFRTVAGFTDSADFNVRALAVTYLARLEHRAVGMLDVPANLYSNDAGAIVRDALHSLGLSQDEVERQMQRFTRGGAGHTKSRIDMDYGKKYDDGAGNTFTLVDFLDNDMNGLYRRYAQRTAGDVALAKYGIMGENGIKVAREAMLRTGASQKALDAFDQLMAEMTGKKVGTGDPLIAQNARSLTNLSRMGGAVFPQMGAYLDAVVGLGAVRALRSAGAINQMRKEVQAMVRGEKVHNPILSGLEGIGPEFGTADYRIFGIFDTPEMADIAGRESVGVVTKAIRAGSNLQRVLSGHRWVTAAQERGFADQIVRKAARFLRETDPGVDNVALKDMGITGEMATTMRDRLKKIATFDKSGELMSFDPRKLDVDDIAGRRAVIAFRDAVMRGTRQIMNKEFPGEVGKWAHNGWLKLLFQFRTFSMVAQQKSFNRILHTRGAAKLTGLLLGGMAVAAPIHMARVALRASLMSEQDRDEFMEKQLHPMALGRATMNYLAAMGLWADVVEAGSGLGTGWADAFGFDMPESLKPTGGRTMKDTDLIGGQLAPSLGVINDIGQGVMGKPDKLWKSAPFASLPYIQPVLMGIDSALDEGE